MCQYRRCNYSWNLGTSISYISYIKTITIKEGTVTGCIILGFPCFTIPKCILNKIDTYTTTCTYTHVLIYLSTHHTHI